VVFMDGLYVPQPSGAPLLDKRASTHWDYAGYLDYDSRRIVRNAGRIAFFDSLLAISTPCGANIFLLGASCILFTALFAPGYAVYGALVALGGMILRKVNASGG
jgi:hypothetical protein